VRLSHPALVYCQLKYSEEVALILKRQPCLKWQNYGLEVATKALAFQTQKSESPLLARKGTGLKCALCVDLGVQLVAAGFVGFCCLQQIWRQSNSRFCNLHI
jgi:hypothetical protein